MSAHAGRDRAIEPRGTPGSERQFHLAIDLMAKRILPTLFLLMTLLVISGSELLHADEKPQQPSGDSGSLELHRRLADEFTNLDPGETGWQSESLSARRASR